MSAQNKILKYNLEDRLLALSALRKTHDEIAKILTQELAGKDTISQNTVSRFLKKVREDRKEIAGAILVDYLSESLPADLSLLDELLKFHAVIFRGKLAAFIETAAEGATKSEPVTLQDRRVAARDIHMIIQTKLRFVGIGGTEGEGDDGINPVDLAKFRRDPQPQHPQPQHPQQERAEAHG